MTLRVILQIAAFGVFSIPIMIYSIPYFRDRTRHGFYRFFLFETTLGLIVLNAPVWFHRPLGFPQVLSWPLLIASIYLPIAAVVLLHRVGRPQGDFENTTQLVSSGIYLYIRHPMYASLLALGWGAFLKHISIFSVLLVFILSVSAYLTAKVEETENQAKFGSAYTEYQRKTRRFIPFIF